MSAFQDAFREIVLPRLSTACDFHAYKVALGDEEFSQASAEVARMALSLGASSLPKAAADSLWDWIDNRILRAMVKFEEQITSYRASVAHVHADIHRLEASRYAAQEETFQEAA